METYFTGTSIECAIQIFKDQYITTEPPERVWKKYSGQYIYMVPSDSNNGEALNVIFEQANHAISQFSHTKRVVFELYNLDSGLMEADPDAMQIESVRYPFDIHISHIKSMYIEKRNNSKMIKQCEAMRQLFEDQRFDNMDFWHLYEQSEFSIKEFSKIINVKDIELIPRKYFFDVNLSVEEYYSDLRYSIDTENNDLFKKMTTDKFVKQYMTQSLEKQVS